MNLKNKKILVARTLGVGIDRITFNPNRIDEIKEILTKQDVRDMFNDGAIMIKEIKGKRAIVKNNKKKGFGKISKRVRNRKRDYMMLTRKLREYAKQLKYQDRLSEEAHKETLKKIKSKIFRSKSHMKELLGGKNESGEKKKKSRKN